MNVFMFVYEPLIKLVLFLLWSVKISQYNFELFKKVLQCHAHKNSTVGQIYP